MGPRINAGGRVGKSSHGAELLSSNDAQKTLDILLKSAHMTRERQIGIVDASGMSATWTGKGCEEWAGHLNDKNVSIHGEL